MLYVEERGVWECVLAIDGCGGVSSECVGETMNCGLSSSVSVDVQSDVVILVYQAGRGPCLDRMFACMACVLVMMCVPSSVARSPTYGVLCCARSARMASK